MHNLVYDQPQSFYDNHLHSAAHSLGAFCSGGTIANITALWVARNKLLGPQKGFSGVAKAGLAAAYRHYNINNLGVMCSKRGHYSLSKAVDVLGLGREQLLTVPAPKQTLDPAKALRIGKRCLLYTSPSPRD